MAWRKSGLTTQDTHPHAKAKLLHNLFPTSIFSHSVALAMRKRQTLCPPGCWSSWTYFSELRKERIVKTGKVESLKSITQTTTNSIGMQENAGCLNLIKCMGTSEPWNLKLIFWTWWSEVRSCDSTRICQGRSY